jgi:precorrin-6B methylase 2
MNFIHKLIPRKIITSIRFITIFNKGFGHSSRDSGFCVDGKGLPIPWITYPCLEFLSRLDFRNANVFEFGSGSSTLWWAKRAKSVHCVEREEDWFHLVQEKLPANSNIQLCRNEGKYAEMILETNINFDVVVVDGAVRYACVEASIKKISDNGIVVLDNSEWYPKACAVLKANGFAQIDFSGFSPINAFTSCTSIFVKNIAALQHRQTENEWTPIGGKFLIAHDDRPFNEIGKETLTLID